MDFGTVGGIAPTNEYSSRAPSWLQIGPVNFTCAVKVDVESWTSPRDSVIQGDAPCRVDRHERSTTRAKKNPAAITNLKTIDIFGPPRFEDWSLAPPLAVAGGNSRDSGGVFGWSPFDLLRPVPPRSECGGTLTTIADMSGLINYRIAMNSIAPRYLSSKCRRRCPIALV